MPYALVLERCVLRVPLQQEALRIDRFHTFGWADRLIAAIDLKLPGAVRIAEQRFEHGVAQVSLERQILDRAEDFDTTIQVALHQVGAADVELLLAAVQEV